MTSNDAEQVERKILEDALISPQAGLMRLTLAIERELRKLLASAGMLGKYLAPPPKTLVEGLRILASGTRIPKALEDKLSEFWDLRNAVTHDQSFLSTLVFDRGLELLRILRSVPRPSYVIRKTNIPLFTKGGCAASIRDVQGIMLETFDDNGQSAGLRVFPTLRNYTEGTSVSWEFSSDFKNHVWNDVWYKDPGTGKCIKQWDSTTAFMGRDLNEV